MPKITFNVEEMTVPEMKKLRRLIRDIDKRCHEEIAADANPEKWQKPDFLDKSEKHFKKYIQEKTAPKIPEVKFIE